MKNFLAHASDRKRTLKRGGGQIFLPLHEEQIEKAESLFQTHSFTSSEDRVFIAAGQLRWSPLDWNGSRQITKVNPRRSSSGN